MTGLAGWASKDGLPDGKVGPAGCQNPVALPHLAVVIGRGPIAMAHLHCNLLVDRGSVQVSRSFVYNHLQDHVHILHWNSGNFVSLLISLTSRYTVSFCSS